MKYCLQLLLLGIISFTACKPSSPDSIPEPIDHISESIHPAFVTNIERAHKKNELFKNEMICFNLDMTFGKRNSLMKIFSTPNSSAIRVDKSDGTSTIMLDGDIYTNADSSSWNREKFGVYTYQYFFMAPYKFSDQGTKWEKLPEMNINDQLLDRSMLTFEAGTGDAPDDWYIVHSDPTSKLVQHIGYIVTGGGATQAEAEKNAHSITYNKYIDVAGVPFASEWIFSDYSKENGVGQQIGNGILRNIEMMDELDHFEIAKTEDYRKIN